ncbi:hypothetical protein Tco_0064204 [Tanacetum coccineum]
MGIGISHDDVTAAANVIGCSTFSTPFKYLGVKVGMFCSKCKSWDEVLAKISSHLSNWKVKTLSIGGRLTLIKSILTSLPLYPMSIYKAPMGVLNSMESLRRRFFNGVVQNEKKLSMISWQQILASKKKGINLHPLMKKKVGNGAQTWFWEDPWIIDSPLRQTYPRMYALEKVKHVSIADKPNDVSLTDSFRRSPRGGLEEEQYL